VPGVGAGVRRSNNLPQVNPKAGHPAGVQPRQNLPALLRRLRLAATSPDDLLAALDS